MMPAEPIEHIPYLLLDRMERELASGASECAQRWSDICDQVKNTPRPEFDAVVVTGCGDSYYAGLSLRHLLEMSFEVPVTAIPAMEAATFAGRLLGPRTLLVGISVSGKVERTIEAVQGHRARGGPTLAITAFGESALAAAAAGCIATEIVGTPGPVPATSTYLGSLLGLIALGNVWGSTSGTAPLLRSEDVKHALDAHGEFVRAESSAMSQVAEAMTPPFFALGSGPDFGTAWFGTAKFLEAATTVGVAQDLEEWAHEQFFATGSTTTVFVHATSPIALERARRVARSATQVGAQVVTISGDRLQVSEEIHCRMPDVVPAVTPLLAWVPMSLVALAHARTHGRAPYGIDTPNRTQTNAEDIYVAPHRAESR